MGKKIWSVTLPIAGHLYVEVEAENEEEAIEKGFSAEFTDSDVEWETLYSFCQGNVCHCPSPWKACAELIDDGE